MTEGPTDATRSRISAGPLRAVALIPARNEAERVAETVEAVRSLPAVERVIVVDDASTDGTGARARGAGAEVMRLDRDLGKGAALNAGLAGLAEDPYDILLLLDGDIGESAHEMASLVGAVAAGVADLAIARMRAPGRPGGFGLVKGLARWGIARHGGPECRAPLSGQRALARALVEAVGGFASGYAVEVDMTVRALDAGFTVTEVDTAMGFQPTGRDLAGFVHRGKQFLAVAGALWSARAGSR